MIKNILVEIARIAQIQLLKRRNDKKIVNLVQKIQREHDSMMWPAEMIQIYHCVQSTNNLEGDLAEVGVYKGSSAKLICEAKGKKILHLFDTFEGLPKPTKIDHNFMHEKKYAADLDLVKSYLSSYKNVFFYPGLFPKTAELVKNKSFAFVHLDVDLYRSTLDCLKFFYPRMVKGGIILSHDYSTLEGVKKAFDEFFRDKNRGPVIKLPTSQCLVVR